MFKNIYVSDLNGLMNIDSYQNLKIKNIILFNDTLN